LKTNLISKSETAQVLKIVSEKWRIDIPKVKNLKVYEIDNEIQLITGKDIKILKIKDEYLPFLSEISTLEKFPFIQVDMGAVKFMCKGANLMRPGIKKFSEFSKDDIVCVVEESQNKFLAVGKSEVNSSELENIDKGEILKNLHYISDKVWEISKTL
jgi:malignant T-cell-amplified sequence